MGNPVNNKAISAKSAAWMRYYNRRNNMFLKITRIKDFEYVKLVESYRDNDGVTRHNVICNFGRLDRMKSDPSFVRSIKKLCEMIEETPGNEN